MEVQVHPGSGLPWQKEEMPVFSERVFYTLWINLRNILLGERSQSQRTTHMLYASICMKCQQTADERLPRAGWDEGEQVGKKWEVTTVNRYGISFWSDKNVLKLIVVMVAS